MGDGELGMMDPSYFEVVELMRERSFEKLRDSMMLIYDFNIKVKVGNYMRCPTCVKSIIKKSYQHKFCCTKHKDKYWNTVNDVRRERAKRYNGK